MSHARPRQQTQHGRNRRCHHQACGYPPVEAFVRQRISGLHIPSPPFLGNRAETVEYAKDLRKQIKKIERMLKAPSSRFLGDRFWSVWSRGGSRGSAAEINPHTRNYLAEEPARLKYLAEQLSLIRSRCDQIIEDPDLGRHGNVKPEHTIAAIESRQVLQVAAFHTKTKLQLSCSQTSKFVIVASLFLEAATGEYGADLRRACKALKAELDAKK